MKKEKMAVGMIVVLVLILVALRFIPDKKAEEMPRTENSLELEKTEPELELTDERIPRMPEPELEQETVPEQEKPSEAYAEQFVGQAVSSTIAQRILETIPEDMCATYMTYDMYVNGFASEDAVYSLRMYVLQDLSDRYDFTRVFMPDPAYISTEEMIIEKCVYYHNGERSSECARALLVGLKPSTDIIRYIDGKYVLPGQAMEERAGKTEYIQYESGPFIDMDQQFTVDYIYSSSGKVAGYALLSTQLGIQAEDCSEDYVRIFGEDALEYLKIEEE